MMEGPKLSNFKIGGPFLQNGKNRKTKTAIKANLFFRIRRTYSVVSSFSNEFSVRKIDELNRDHLLINFLYHLN
jgi:hypothetical protein